MAQSDEAMRVRIDQIGDRQEVMIGAINDMTSCFEIMNDKIDAVIAWTQTPPSNDLSETLQAMTRAINELSHQVADLVHRNCGGVNRG